MENSKNQSALDKHIKAEVARITKAKPKGFGGGLFHPAAEAKTEPKAKPKAESVAPDATIDDIVANAAKSVVGWLSEEPKPRAKPKAKPKAEPVAPDETIDDIFANAMKSMKSFGWFSEEPKPRAKPRAKDVAIVDFYELLWGDKSKINEKLKATAEPVATNETSMTEEQRKIRAVLAGITSHIPRVGVFGDTGVGKSSLCNALFGKEIAATSEVKACTRHPQEIFVGLEGKGIMLVDVPGIGEDPETHKKYTALYKSLMPELDMILWCIKADDRKFFAGIDVYNQLLKPHKEKCPVVFVITQADKIEPLHDWDKETNTPGSEQTANIKSKVGDIASRFGVRRHTIIPVAANDGYNLIELADLMVYTLPKTKKYAVAHEIKKELLSEKAKQQTEESILENIRRGWLEKKDDDEESVYKKKLRQLKKKHEEDRILKKKKEEAEELARYGLKPEDILINQWKYGR